MTTTAAISCHKNLTNQPPPAVGYICRADYSTVLAWPEIFIFQHMTIVYLSIYLSIHPSIHLHMPCWLFYCSIMTWNTYLSTHDNSLSIYLSIYPSIHPSIHPPIYLIPTVITLMMYYTITKILYYYNSHSKMKLLVNFQTLTLSGKIQTD